MTDSFSSWKRKTLEKRKSNLYEELEAANEQLGQMLGAAVRLRIKRKIASLEEEIQEIEEELNRLTPSPAQQNGESKAPEGTQPAAPQELFGTGNRWAVLVGANQYEDWDYYRSLHVCVKDAAALHDQLILGGVNTANIHMLTDETDVPPTRGKILSLLQLAANTAERDDMLLFYYSGHGEADGGESYLVARDGHYNALRDTAVPISRVKEILQGSEARAKVIILDACHSGADFEGKGPKPMSPAFIQHVFEQAKGLAVLVSCEQGEFSYEWQDRERSAFTHFLLEALAGSADYDGKGFVTVQDANRYLVAKVKQWAFQNKHSQTPTVELAMSGDIVLTYYDEKG